MPLTDPCPACGKVCYTLAEARRKARGATRRGDPEYKGTVALPYKCKSGGSAWHFGHSTKEPAIERKRRKKH